MISIPCSILSSLWSLPLRKYRENGDLGVGVELNWKFLLVVEVEVLSVYSLC